MSRTYGQYCTLAKALDLIGERWTLLVLRELLVGTTSFSELQRHLPGCSPTLLSERLRALVERGLAVRGDGGYHATARGRQLEAALVELGRFGADLLGSVGDDALVPHTAPLALKTLMRFEALPSRSLVVLIGLPDGDWTISVAARRRGARDIDRVAVVRGVLPRPHARVDATMAEIVRARRGRRVLTVAGAPWAVAAVRAVFSPAPPSTDVNSLYSGRLDATE